VRSDFPDLIDERDDRDDRKEKVPGVETAGKLATLDEVEEMHIRKVLKENGTLNKGEVCEILGITRPTLERKLDKYGIVFERD
jgi:two-component system response regulator AtoC